VPLQCAVKSYAIADPRNTHHIPWRSLTSKHRHLLVAQVKANATTERTESLADNVTDPGTFDTDC